MFLLRERSRVIQAARQDVRERFPKRIRDEDDEEGRERGRIALEEE